MSAHNSTSEGTKASLKIHLILHLLFLETQRVNILASQLPLCLIYLIMRMSMQSLIFSNRSFHDLFTPIFNHDDDSIAIDFLKPPVLDYLSINEVETP